MSRDPVEYILSAGSVEEIELGWSIDPKYKPRSEARKAQDYVKIVSETGAVGYKPRAGSNLGFTLATTDEIPEVSIFDVEADIDLVVEALASDQNALAKKIQADLKQALELSSPESILGAVRAVLDNHKDDLVRMLASAGAAAGLVGLAKLSQAIPQVVSSLDEPEPAQAIPPGQVTPAAQELVQGAVGELRGKRAILPTVVQGRIEAARRSANQVAQVQAQNAQQILQDTLAETVEEGGDVESFRSKVKQVLGERSFLADRHVENVFRTNVMEAYSQARLEMVESDPQVGSLYPYAAIHATHDDRVRPEHKSMETRGLDGTNVYRMDDPVFRKYRGPWDFGCRCLWIPYSVAQAARAGVLEAQRWQETGRAPAVPQHVPLPPFEVTSGFERQLATATTASVNLVDLLLSAETPRAIELAWEAVESRSDNQKWVGVGEDKGKKPKYLPRGVDPNKGKKRTARTGTQKKAGDSTPPPQTPADEGQRKPWLVDPAYLGETADRVAKLALEKLGVPREVLAQAAYAIATSSGEKPEPANLLEAAQYYQDFVIRSLDPEKEYDGTPALGRAKAAMEIFRGRPKPKTVESQPATKGKVLYSGVVLDKGSRAKLLKQFAQYIPKGWKPLAHHMTTAFGKALPEGLAGLEGELRVTHIGWDKELGVVAVQVESDIPSENNIPHITLAVSPTGKPKDSNRITNWKPVSRPLVLQGKAQDVHAEDKPRPKLTGMAKELAAAAEGARELAEELRAQGDHARADHLEGLAKKYAADSERMAGK